MSKITTTEEADVIVKQNVKSTLNLTPVAMGEPQVIEGTDIKYWHILYQNPDQPDEQPKPLIGGPRQVVLDSGQIISIPVRPPGPDSKSFKELVLEQYRSDS
jgi:hypothetical protein